LIHEILQKLEKRRINFYIDLQGIAKGFYNKDNIMIELGRYATDGKPSDILIQELREFLNNLFVQFKRYDPFFILFFDDGICLQQKAIDNSYKERGSILNVIFENDQERDLYREIKKYYFKKIKEDFTKKDICHVYYLKEYEADFIPYYVISEGKFEADEPDILNVILAVDKDLLQTCEFINTIQCVTSFKKNPDNKRSGYEIQFDVYDRDNAISYINKKFKRGILTARFIPMILALSGDKSDKIKGIKNIGGTRAIELIIDYSIPATIYELKSKLDSLPDIIKNNIDMIERNFKLISFEEQIKRVPRQIFMQ
jgi:hypothetical protein